MKAPSGTVRLSPATDLLRYAGKVPYVWGGADPVSGWDCSGAVNWVLGHDLGMTLPGGIKGFDGSYHGPVVLDYAAWGGAVTVASPVAGDLCIWAGSGADGHIGIAISPQRMVAALDPALGTAVTPIQGAGPGGVQVMFRRVTGAPGGGVWAGIGSGIVSGLLDVTGLREMAAGALVALGVTAAGVAAVTGAAVAAGLLTAGVITAGFVWLGRESR